MARNDVKAQVYQGLIKRGLPEHVAQGFMMNFQDESGFNVDITEGEANVHGTYGKGLYQLTGSRRDAFEARFGGDYSIDNQLDWLMHELDGSESSARDRIMATGSAGEAGAAIVSNFLRPAKEHENSRRAAYLGGNGDTSLSGGGGSATVTGQQADDTLGLVTPEQEQSLYAAYTSGQMSPSERAEYEGYVQSGQLSPPAPLDNAQQVNAQVVGGDEASRIYDAFLSGRMSPEEEQEYLSFVQGGALSSPATIDQLSQFSQQRNDPMYFGGVPTNMPGIGQRAATNTRTELDLTRKYGSAAGGDLFMQGVGGLMGGDSPTGAALPVEGGLFGAAIRNAPIPMLGGMGMQDAGDLGLSLLGGAGAIGGGLAGLAGDTSELLGASRGSSQRLARDLAAIPEALAGSPVSMGASAQSRVNGTVRARQGQAAANAPGPRPNLDTPVDHTAPITRPAPIANMGETEAQNLAPIIGEAAKNNPAARQRLADMAEVDPAALAAADRAGFDAPVDVFANNPQIQQAVGAVRAVNGSDAAAEWEATIRNAQGRASEIITAEGASPSLAAASERVQDTLTSSINQLRTDGGAIFEDIAQQVPSDARIAPPAASKLLADRVEALGGADGLSAPVRRLQRLLDQDGGITYERLKTERAQIGRAAFSQQGPYADADQRTLTQLYNALGEDQVNFVRAEVGDQAAERLTQANSLWSQAKDLEDSLVSAFGRDQQGSVANKLRSAVTNASRGDAAALNRVMDVIPENLQREALLSAINEVVTVQSGQGGFSFAAYAKTYRGLRQNEPIYSRVADTLGNDTSNMMRDLYEVSVRMDRAAQRVSTTGKSNQAILFADGFMGRVLDSTAGRTARGAAAGAATAATGAGGMFSGVAAVAAANGKLSRSRQQAAGLMFRSDQFQRLAREAATKGQVSDNTIRDVQRSPAYKRWSREVGVPDTWLVETLARGASLQEENEGPR